VTLSSVHSDGETAVTWLFLRGKALADRAVDLMNILKDVLLTVRLDNRDRFRQMLLEEKAGLEQGIVPGGHRFVNLRLCSHFSEAHWAAEQMGGISYLFFLRRLIKRVEDDWPGVLGDLEAMRRILVRRPDMILNVTLDEENGSKTDPLIIEFLEALPASPVKREPWSMTSPPPFEGMTIPSRINYVGKATGLYGKGYRFHGSALVISRYLQTGWLWEKVRVQGGAYGAFCMFDRFSGVLSLVSYRDPNILETLDVFDRTADFLKELQLGDEERVKSIIGAVGGLDAHLLPDAKGHVSMIRHLCGDSDGDRQRMREELLETSAGHFKDFAGNLQALSRGGMVKVMGSGEAIASINESHPDWLKVVKVL
jgi:Zn-dependent M16 (insulinase) family peptidase